MKKEATDKINFRAVLLLSAAVSSWALNTVLAKGMVDSIEPMTLSFFRWLTAFIVILPFGLKRVLNELPTIKKNFRNILVLSIFSISLYNSLIYCAAEYTTATNMAFVVAATPATTFLLSWLLIRKRERAGRTGAMLISFTGMLVIVFKGSIQNLISLDINGGDLITFAAVLSWSSYSVLLGRMKPDMDHIAFLTITILAGLPFILPFHLLELSRYGMFAFNPKNVVTIIFLGIFPSIISYLCWNEGVKLAGPNMASLFLYLIPVIASAIALFWLGEKIHFYHIAGGSAILVGMMLYFRQA